MGPVQRPSQVADQLRSEEAGALLVGSTACWGGFGDSLAQFSDLRCGTA